MNRRDVSRPTLALGIAAVALSVVTLVGLPTPLQAVAAIGVLILLPGQALARLVPMTDVALGVLLVLGLGLAALTAVSTAMAVITVLACAARARQEVAS
jgi:hypothetical protein